MRSKLWAASCLLILGSAAMAAASQAGVRWPVAWVFAGGALLLFVPPLILDAVVAEMEDRGR